MLRNSIWMVLTICFVFGSCDSNRVFDAYKSIPNQWNKDSIISFKFNPPDSINSYNLFINLRNTNEYKYSNLFLIVEMDFPNGKILKDTLEYKMADPNGKLLGTGFTDVKENKLWYKGYKEPFVFNETGEYLIRIQQAMRQNGQINGVDNLEGITDIGFRVEHSETD